MHIQRQDWLLLLVAWVVLVVPEDPAEPKDPREHLEQVVLLQQEVQVVLHM